MGVSSLQPPRAAGASKRVLCLHAVGGVLASPCSRLQLAKLVGCLVDRTTVVWQSHDLRDEPARRLAAGVQLAFWPGPQVCRSVANRPTVEILEHLYWLDKSILWHHIRSSLPICKAEAYELFRVPSSHLSGLSAFHSPHYFSLPRCVLDQLQGLGHTRSDVHWL